MSVKGSIAKSDKVRMGMERADYDFLLAEAERNGQSISGYIKRALARNRYIDEGLRAGDLFLVERASTGRTHEIIFK